MALATQCPHCFTTFRVAADQLKLRGGIVRCGSCQSIFDGNAHLIDLDKLAAEKAAGDAAPQAGSAAGADAVPAAAIEAAPDVSTDAATTDATGPVAPADHAGIVATPLPLPAPAAPSSSSPAPAHVWRTAAQRPDEAAAMATAGPLPPADTYIPRTRIEPSFGVPEPVLAPDIDATHAPLPTLLLEHTAATPATPDDAGIPPADETQHAAADPDPDTNIDTATVAAIDIGAAPDSAPADAAPADAAPAVPSPAPAAMLSAALPLRASSGSETVPALAVAPVVGPKTARSKSLEARTRRSKLTPTKIETSKLRVPADDIDEPEFVKRSRRQERSTRTRRIAMGGGAAVLALVLAAQVVVEYRNVLAARYPAAKPMLGAACALLDCHVTLPHQVDNLAIETGELTTLGANTYALTTLLRNEGNLAQAWPSIELELIDADDKPVLRRVFGPADYLPLNAPVAAGLGARAEQPVRLHFALADLKPAGYHTFVFYP
jgi:predicted Zn finger-like uncharacterized protein